MDNASPDGTNEESERRREEEGPFAGLDRATRDLFGQIARAPNCLDRLTAQIAPEIYGHENIKKGILLMLVAGVEKSTQKDGIKLRGDINVCIVGDPGTAKSQMLKFVQFFAGRAVFTSGKSSTAAGLTASVHRDPDQGDAVIEAGALMLADKGICCIDEFDKMDDKDMVAIHEALEQQTISITKAGIQATLNARASVLAACNPSGGRYDASRTFRQNVRLSAPIMSRFDLFFVMLDDTDQDDILARHMVKMHADPEAFFANTNGLTREQLQSYIRTARGFKPKLTEAAKEVLVRAYVALRQQDVQPGSCRSVRMTVRQLESLIRLSEAIAKLRFTHDVTAAHVQEAYRLFHNSLTKIKKGHIDLYEDEEDELAGGLLEGETEEECQARLQREREDLRIDASDFERVAHAIIDFMMQHERDSLADGVDAAIPRDDVITWYINEHFDADSEYALQREYKRLVLIITRMANRDYTLIEETQEQEVVCGDTVELDSKIVLRLHPNYYDRASYGGIATNVQQSHANLNTSCFADAHSGVAPTNDVTNAFGLDDDEFVAYMYGDVGANPDADMSME